MRRRLPPLNALRAFEAAARHNSFTGAAAELNVSHAAISRHVRSLEARLDVALFHNAKRGVELTSAGTEYLCAVSAALDAIADATDALTQRHDTMIRVSIHPAFAARWLVQRLAGFRKLHSTYEVVLEATPRLADLERDEADLAIGNGHTAGPHLGQELLARSCLRPVCSPSLVGGRTEKVAPQDLLAYVLLHDEADAGLWRRWFAAAGITAAEVSRGPRILESGLAIDAAIAGQGVALADDFLVADDLAAGRLVQLCDVALTAGDCNYYLRHPEGAGHRRPVQAFRSWLLSESEALRSTVRR